MRPNTSSSVSVVRAGLSIMEVLFAIAVLTIGMLGIASILPVATNNSATALQTDRAVEEINNRVASDLARLRGNFTEVIVAENSLASFNSAAVAAPLTRPGERYFPVSTSGFAQHLDRYDMRFGSLAGGVSIPLQPSLPDAFCIDPWFLSAANTLRDDQTSLGDDRNGYDRTVFPCFDPRYHPLAFSPSERLASSSGTGWEGPRFTRVAIPAPDSGGFLSPNSSEDLMRQGDDVSLFKPDDRTLPASLFVQRSRSTIGTGADQFRALTKNTISSRYSSVVMLSRSAAGSDLFNAAIVTMEDRHIVTVEGGDFGPLPGGSGVFAHNLREYTATDPAVTTGSPVPDDQLLYPGEQLGYVAFANAPFTGGGGGEFIFRTNRFVRPDISDGDWIMLMRREHVRDPEVPAGFPDPVIRPTTLHFAWYKVDNVSEGPTIVTTPSGTFYQTQVAVRGSDWLFHPIQTEIAPGSGVYGPPYYGNAVQPTWGGTGVFDIELMPARGTDPAAAAPGTRPFSPFYEHQDYGTFVVIMPDVISVKQFQIRL